MENELKVPTDIGNEIHKEKPSVFRLINEANSPVEVLIPFYFDDYYFTPGSNIYNPQLATMSFILALSAFSHFRDGANRYKNQDADLRYLLTGEASDSAYPYRDYRKYDTKTLGFDQYQENEFYHKQSQENSIAFAFATRRINSEKVICVVIRGGGYENEWCGNMEINPLGEGKYHNGFYKAGMEVVEALQKYMHIVPSGRTKLWIVGYSRGAAVANLTALIIKEHWQKIWGISDRDIYTYTFETPAGLYDKKDDCLGVYNHMNYLDLVTKLVFGQWKFSRVGIDHIFTKANDTDWKTKWLKAANCMKFYLKQDYRYYEDFIETELHYTRVDNLIANFASATNREEFGKKYQKPTAVLVRWALTLTAEEIKRIDKYRCYIMSIISSLKNKEFNDFNKHMEDFLKLVSPNIDKQKITKLTDSVKSLRDFIVAAFPNDLYKLFIMLIFFMAIPLTHSPMLCLSWLMSLDKNYEQSTESVTIKIDETSLATNHLFSDLSKLASMTNEDLETMFSEINAHDDPSEQNAIITSWVSRYTS